MLFEWIEAKCLISSPNLEVRVHNLVVRHSIQQDSVRLAFYAMRCGVASSRLRV